MPAAAAIEIHLSQRLTTSAAPFEGQSAQMPEACPGVRRADRRAICGFAAASRCCTGVALGHGPSVTPSTGPTRFTLCTSVTTATLAVPRYTRARLWRLYLVATNL